jgi:hypothetical protein
MEDTYKDKMVVSISEVNQGKELSFDLEMVQKVCVVRVVHVASGVHEGQEARAQQDHAD